MMLRSLVKKFKSHSLNEDDGQQQSPTGDAPIGVLSLDQSHVIEGDQSAVTTKPDQSTPNTTSVMGQGYEAPRHQYQAPGPVRHHHLRSSVGCGCNGKTVSSIATRLRSSVMAAHGHHGCPCPNVCQHRRSSQGGPRYHHGQGSTSKTTADGNNANVDEDCCKDSGTESDDEELERIETNSTHSVPVSQTSDYYASQQSLSINSCRSSHCSSPLLGLSDQECNSWESIGSESGISVRAAGSCQHRHACRGSTAGVPSMATTFMRPPSEMLMREELPQHHYHTRQQFHRLTQQISMKKGLIGDGKEEDEQPTAFVPVRPMATALAKVEQSPEGAGSSSLDELEEVNFGQQKPRRSRACTTSVMTGGGSISEKRKWSQMRQDQKRQAPISGEEQEKKLRERPVLQAARKTPIKLLFSLDGRSVSGRGQIHSQQLPQQGNVSPPAGSMAKKLRSTRRKCKCDEEGADRCPKEDDDEEEDEETANDDQAQRPSLDFNKMRGKLVGIGATGGGNKKHKRSASLINCSGMKAKLKTIGGRREGYQLRSTHRQCCLFRPLEPPSTSAPAPDQGTMVAEQTPSSSTWFGSVSNQQEQVFQPWQQGLSGTFYFGSNAPSE